MRTLLAFAFLGAVAANDECPIVHWLKEHGKDAFETVIECKDLGADIQKAMQSHCSKKPSPADQVTMAVWWAIRELEKFNSTLPEIVKNHYGVMEEIKSLATTRLVASTHEYVDDYCNNPRCMDLTKEISFKVSPCYASLTCSFLTHLVPFSSCKDVFQTYMNSFIDIYNGNMCDSDEIGGGAVQFYCSEMDADLMFKETDCFLEYNKLNDMSDAPPKCTPKCVKQWQGMKTRLPKCTKQLISQQNTMTSSMATLVKDLAKVATDPNFKRALEDTPTEQFSYDEHCNHKGPHVDASGMQVV